METHASTNNNNAVVGVLFIHVHQYKLLKVESGLCPLVKPGDRCCTQMNHTLLNRTSKANVSVDGLTRKIDG